MQIKQVNGDARCVTKVGIIIIIIVIVVFVVVGFLNTWPATWRQLTIIVIIIIIIHKGNNNNQVGGRLG